MKTTYFARKEDFKDSDKKWYLFDADGVVLGRLASRIANVLRGKDKPTFTPHIDTGAHVIVLNASKVRLTGVKLSEKIYYHHTGWMGHLKSATAAQMLLKHPERVIESAVYGMLPGNRMRKQYMKKLKIYAGTEHPHVAQQPAKMEM